MVILLPLLAAVSTLSTNPTPIELRQCDGDTTQQVDDCLSKEAAAAEATLQKYRAKAVARLKRDEHHAQQDSGEPEATDDFDKAERAWNAYRDAECGAAFDYWSGGTIAVSVEQTCRIRLTRLHTHTIWREWLTYFDSTPPLLPEPSVPAEP